MLVVDIEVELVIVEVDVVVSVVERVVDDVGVNVVEVDKGGVVTTAGPRIPPAEELDTARTPTSERSSATLSTVTRGEFFLLLIYTTSARELVSTITTLRASRTHQPSLVGLFAQKSALM